jgi:hypothetical protein
MVEFVSIVLRSAESVCATYECLTESAKTIPSPPATPPSTPSKRGVVVRKHLIHQVMLLQRRSLKTATLPPVLQKDWG